MKISIVTISFNQAQYLRQCIDSVLSQPVDDLEYIVVDPGSTDGSRDIIESYGDRIIKVLQPDKGPPDGLNAGFARATGEIFGFLNSDDYLLPGALEKICPLFEKSGGNTFFSAGGFIENLDGKLQPVNPTQMKLYPMLYGACTVFQQGTFFTSAMFDKVGGFCIENGTCWDGQLFCDLLAAGFAHEVIDAQVAVFRLHENSISGSNRLVDAYRADLRKIFRSNLGREYTAIDAVISLLWRARKLASARLASIAARF
jgi:glycosyltransferase involved in cell wall biosynthesis